MRLLFAGFRRKLAVGAVLVVVAAGVLWWQHAPLLSWYYLRGLADADAADRAAWVEHVVSLDADVVPGLIDLLKRGDPRVCANSEAALAALAKQWGPSDPRTAAAAADLTAAFPALSPPGREAALEWYLVVLRDTDPSKAPGEPVTKTACKLLQSAAEVPDKGCRLRTLALAEVLLGRAAPVRETLCRELAVQGMNARDSDLRAAALRLTMHAPLHTDKTLVDRVVPFLKDGAPEVRRSAVLALSLAEETISVQELLPLLHDPDTEVQRLCKLALQSRGLKPADLPRAFLISHPRPDKRLEIVHELTEADDLAGGILVWLMYMSQDPSPAVRAAALRLAADDPAAVDFQDRMLQMAREDPSPTVRQLALHYARAIQQRR
jgi:HEAT repeat protein